MIYNIDEKVMLTCSGIKKLYNYNKEKSTTVYFRYEKLLLLLFTAVGCRHFNIMQCYLSCKLTLAIFCNQWMSAALVHLKLFINKRYINLLDRN